MPIGSGRFPVVLPQCPGNGLVVCKTFSKEEVAKLEPIVAGAEYRALRATETPYFLAARLATALGDSSAPWLLLSATWEAKEAGGGDERTRRYNEAFVAAVEALPATFAPLDAAVLLLRAANALRELGRFEAAERLRAAVVIEPGLFKGEDASRQRGDWERYRSALTAPIARRDPSRAPLDMLADGVAVVRCIQAETGPQQGEGSPQPLTAFERGYCARPEMVAELARVRKARGE